MNYVSFSGQGVAWRRSHVWEPSCIWACYARHCQRFLGTWCAARIRRSPLVDPGVLHSAQRVIFHCPGGVKRWSNSCDVRGCRGARTGRDCFSSSCLRLRNSTTGCRQHVAATQEVWRRRRCDSDDCLRRSTFAVGSDEERTSQLTAFPSLPPLPPFISCLSLFSFLSFLPPSTLPPPPPP